MTGEEINVLMNQGAEAGVFHEKEEVIVSNVLQLAEQRIGTIMTHRSNLYSLDLKASAAEIRGRLENSPFSRIVVCRGGLENIAGILNTCDVLKTVLRGESLEIEKLLQPPLYVPENATAASLLEIFRQRERQCALVVDEYGGLQGLVTLSDVLASIVGDFSSAADPAEQSIIVREDNSLLVDGDVSIERIKAVLALPGRLPGESENAFNTISGFIMHALGRIPKTADRVDWNGWRFEVVDMDLNRIDKLLISRIR
ncbi:MAG: Magnesium and cobalt efflux protein CorC [Lentisphaerae bacterium ADurb.Bin242]|nr:MAG: Magnesium and cobalt efflux protein CorC [Lentisphaerae bacterium ADurb.Bin242]